jgi:hypothetical protein
MTYPNEVIAVSNMYPISVELNNAVRSSIEKGASITLGPPVDRSSKMLVYLTVTEGIDACKQYFEQLSEVIESHKKNKPGLQLIAGVDVICAKRDESNNSSFWGASGTSFGLYAYTQLTLLSVMHREGSTVFALTGYLKNINDIEINYLEKLLEAYNKSKPDFSTKVTIKLEGVELYAYQKQVDNQLHITLTTEKKALTSALDSSFVMNMTEGTSLTYALNSAAIPDKIKQAMETLKETRDNLDSMQVGQLLNYVENVKRDLSSAYDSLDNLYWSAFYHMKKEG